MVIWVPRTPLNYGPNNHCSVDSSGLCPYNVRHCRWRHHSQYLGKIQIISLATCQYTVYFFTFCAFKIDRWTCFRPFYSFKKWELWCSISQNFFLNISYPDNFSPKYPVSRWPQIGPHKSCRPVWNLFLNSKVLLLRRVLIILYNEVNGQPRHFFSFFLKIVPFRIMVATLATGRNWFLTTSALVWDIPSLVCWPHFSRMILSLKEDSASLSIISETLFSSGSTGNLKFTSVHGHQLTWSAVAF